MPALPERDTELKVLYSGTDEDEAVRVAKAASAKEIYAKVLAKALGGITLYRAIHPAILANTQG